jgi:hypothetical protein
MNECNRCGAKIPVPGLCRGCFRLRFLSFQFRSSFSGAGACRSCGDFVSVGACGALCKECFLEIFVGIIPGPEILHRQPNVPAGIRVRRKGRSLTVHYESVLPLADRIETRRAWAEREAKREAKQ